MRMIQVCLAALSEAVEEFGTLQRVRVAEVAKPPTDDPNSRLWGEWMAAKFPMSTKAIQLLRLLLSFRVSYQFLGPDS